MQYTIRKEVNWKKVYLELHLKKAFKQTKLAQGLVDYMANILPSLLILKKKNT